MATADQNQNEAKSTRSIILNHISTGSATSSTSFPTLSASDGGDDDESTASSSALTPTKGEDGLHEVNKLPGSGLYSGRHPVPRIQSYWELYPDRTTPPPSPTPQEINAEKRERRRKVKENSKIVTDPITGKNITICDAKYKPPHEAPQTARGTFPPSQWHVFLEQLRGLTLKYVAFVAASFVLINGCLRLPFSVSILATIAGGVTWWRNVDGAWANFCHSVESDQGKKSLRTPGIRGNESVEWLNGVLTKLWPQVNTDLFVPIVDLLEDVMQASIPSFITQVKIVNIGQGVTPLRVLSIRWLDEKNENNHKVPETTYNATGPLNEEEQIGEWASLEVSFAYRAQPSSASARSKAKNANLLVHFYMGLNGFFGAPIPVWVELRGVTGTCRMKIQLIPDPPFVKLGTFTLLGMPNIEIAAVPMNQRFFNVMNLPVVSDFINSSIRAAAQRFVAPSNYTLDLAKVLVGDDTKKELLTIGALVVHVHSATGVMACDVDGKSDCYATLSYSKCRKPVWSTRIIFNELDPIWDETAIMLLGSDEVKAAEGLSLQLYDSDRFTADDILGRTEIDVTSLVRNPGKVFEREDNLVGVTDGSTMPGTVKWSMVYYGNRALNKALETDGVDERLPTDLKHLEQKLSTRQSSETGMDTTCIPPDPAFPSGILAIQVHNIVGLERHIISGSKGSSGLRRGEAQTAQEEEEGQNLPSAYVSIALDYQTIYRTRIKPMTSKPFFNAGTERFVRDWTKTKVLIVVRDARVREEDPILGCVNLTLNDVMAKSSQVSRFYPIQGGVGYGKIRISLLFRSIDAQLPKVLLGADIGSIEIVSRHISSASIKDHEVRKADIIKFATPIIRKDAVRERDGWAPVHDTKGSTGFRLGVRHRHSAPCILYFRRDSKIRRDKVLAMAVFWLKDIPDDEIVSLTLPLYRPDNMERFAQNCGVADGKHVGFVELAVRFHRGLGHSHRRAGVVEKDFKDVIDAVACVEHIRGEGPLIISDNEVSDSEDDGKGRNNSRPASRGLGGRSHKTQDETKQLHRMERGAMQWKGARTLAWVGEGIKEKGREMRGALRMEPKRPGIESEV